MAILRCVLVDVADGIQGRIGSYLRHKQGIIALDSPETQKYHAMLNLLHRGFKVRILSKVARKRNAVESEARKLCKFKFPFNQAANGRTRSVNFTIPGIGKRVNSYRRLYGRRLNSVGATLDLTLLCEKDACIGTNHDKGV